MGELSDVEDVLARAGFDASESALTRRQAEVLALRERGLSQADVADSLGTSRANISKVEAAARENVAKARETVAFVEALEAPVQVEVEAGTDLYDVPEAVFDACDEAGVKVAYSGVDMMTRVSEAAGDAVVGREVKTTMLVGVTREGDVRVRVAPD
ncbi:Tfx family DNA-binding protein [Salarchaeum japonicum]|uniref:Tfx family DNA-binding protein n=1 Tax=Salarchaeum japonicum TaxID=555573 RepID=UPI001D0ACCFE|nr:Tfx family DNA-binding protein [Salarchaeum japonicum]